MSNDALPDPAPRARRLTGGPPMKSLRVRLKTITPILGGSSAARELDELDPLRAPSIRGHLRFWWRALHGHACATPAELARRERELWGGMGKEQGTRSRVEVRVEVEPRTVSRDDGRIDQRARGAYALWVASKPLAPRWHSSLCFHLHLLAPAERFSEVEGALRAWVLWGGYGSRTRRGLGALTVVDDAAAWLPRQPTREEWSRLFPELPLFGALPPGGAKQVPLLRGARLLYGASRPGADDAWEVALGWLREFRQGEGRLPQGSRVASPGKKGEGRSATAREPRPERPGRSYWPEADKVRQLFSPPKGTSWAHPPRPACAGKAVAWPRAGFGLPLAIRFQRTARPKTPGGRGAPYAEPPDVELRWHDGTRVRERFASPLIVKAMPLADGSFVPIALWLRRAWPEKGQVVLMGKAREPVRGSAAPFDRLLAPGDTALYAPLVAENLEEAFLGWVKGFSGVKEST
ncbi:type III-B CRISPR module RAMP protein Cmr1 [Vitiosangium sp. GDMCC 1.1324]|uniref:type III-B CRISPR module RAMP protein Cmr1 n=1 Tax=Vitiosangium sp. (strain GDMCC 1.1324) TaxID=2138576 RepID=UPI000D3A2F1E|nr:type III-B CRISPR module RAMP protein Cmr1 [Vitiosangium sp. GDMCC 1.1324]PTL82521.1 type III-B CRISPR module RAMP protein Cmr1 [Vitiosangium sp. GDMCC 1.1324]